MRIIYTYIIYPVCREKTSLQAFSYYFFVTSNLRLRYSLTVVKCAVRQKMKTVRDTKNCKLCTCMYHNTTTASYVAVVTLVYYTK